VAKEQFSKVLELQPKNYDAMNGLGAALRGLKDLDGAEAQYKKAKDLDPKRGEAYYNLAVLYKDFRASKQEDLRKAQDIYRSAKGFFNVFMSKTGDAADKAEAKEQVAMIEKTIKQLDDFLKNAPPAAPAAPAAPAPAAPPAKK
jgi:tetratricopeptide (TPR) repeat protein